MFQVFYAGSLGQKLSARGPGKRLGRVIGGRSSSTVNLGRQTELPPNCDKIVSTTRFKEATYPSVLMHIQNIPVPTYVDGGSEVTLIDSAYLCELPLDGKDLVYPPPPGTVRGVVGESLSVSGQIYLPLRIGNFQCVFPFLIVESLNPPVILGSDFFKPYRCNIDYDTDTLHIAKGAYREPFLSSSSLDQVIPSNPVIIPPRSEIMLPCRVSCNQIGVRTCLFQPVELPEGVISVDSVVKLDSCGQVPVRLINTNQDEVKLKTKDAIGFLEPTESITELRVASLEPDVAGVCGAVAILDDIVDSERWLSEFQLGVQLRQEQKSKVFEILRRRRDAISVSSEDIGFSDLVVHDIKTGTHAPVSRPPYRANPLKQLEIDKEVMKLKNLGVIEPSNSPWASPVVMVRKSDGSWRLCVDYRSVNNITEVPSFPLPRTDDIFESLKGSRFFCTLDLNQAYYQVKLNPADAPKTAFVTRDSLYQFNRMPFGLSGAPGTCQRLMNLILKDVLYKKAIAYLDDVIVFGESFEQTLSNLDVVLQHLASAGVKVKPMKCQLFQSEIVFLGHVISESGIHTDPKKVEAIVSWPKPLNSKDIKSFLGLVNYYQKFVPNLSQVASPLRVLEHSKSWKWTAECEAAFNEIKKLLTTAPILGFPDFSPSASAFVLDCDASDAGVGAVLSQDQDGETRIIAYGSKALSKEQRSYCPTQKEMFSLVFFVEYFREYLLPRPFIIRTDHSALKWLNRARSSRNDMLIRWNTILDNFTFEVDGDILGRLQEYNFQILYRPGKYHGNADSLSRKPFRKAGHEECPSCNPHTAMVSQYLPNEVTNLLSELSSQQVSRNVRDQDPTRLVAPLIGPDLSQDDDVSPAESDSETDTRGIGRSLLATDVDISTAQKGDSDLSPVVSLLVSGAPKPVRERLSSFSRGTRIVLADFERLSLVDGVLVRKTKKGQQVVVPWKLRSTILKGAHDESGHGGLRQTRLRLTNRFWWPDCTQEVEDYVRCCLTCAQTRRTGRHRVAPLQPHPKGYVNQVIHLDLAGPLQPSKAGNVYLCVMIDRFTSWMEVVPIPDKTAETVASAFVQQWVCRYGIPESLYTDQGQEVSGKLMKSICTQLGVQKIRTSPRHPQADGKVERVIQQLKAGLRMFLAEKGSDWESHLSPVLLNLRTIQSASSGFTPAMMTLGRELLLPYESNLSLPSRDDVSAYDFCVQLRDQLQVVHHHARLKYLGAQRQQKRYFDTKVYGKMFQLGDWAFVRGQPTHSLDPVQYVGPYEVVGCFAESLYELVPARGEDGALVNASLCDSKRRVHFNNLRPVQAPGFVQQRQAQHQWCEGGCPCRTPGAVVDISTQTVPLHDSTDGSEDALESICADWELHSPPSTEVAIGARWAREMLGSGSDLTRTARRRRPNRRRPCNNRRDSLWEPNISTWDEVSSSDPDSSAESRHETTFSDPDSDTDPCALSDTESTDAMEQPF